MNKKNENVTVTELKSAVKGFEELEFKDDFMFGVIMRNPKYCKPFLEMILGIKISDIKYPKTQETINKNLPKRARYYQGMIDLNILEKGEDYKNLKRSFVIFICTFDLFGKGRHIYTFENRCIQDYEIGLGDETTKIILNTKGTMNDVSPEMKRLLNYIDGQASSDEFTQELETAVKTIKNNERWRVEYMTLEMRYRELLEQGMEQGIEQTALRMLQAGELSVEKIALYSGLDIEKVLELKDNL